MVLPIALSIDDPSNFTGFGDDPNWSVKFGVYRGEGNSAADWESGSRKAQLVPATGNDIITQIRGRDPWTITLRLWFASGEDADRMDAMVNTRATLRYLAGANRRLGGSKQVIGNREYYVYPGTMLTDFRAGETEPDGSCEATATFMRPYIAPPVVVPPVWPEPPYPGVRYLPDPLLFLTQPYSRNAGGAIAPASGAARPVTMGGYGAWRTIPAAKNAIRNPLFVGTGNWAWNGSSTLSPNGDGSARYQAATIFESVDQAAGTGLAAVQGETVTLSVWMKSRTTTKTVNMQFYAHSANNYSGNTGDQQNNNKTVTTSWQQFTVTRTLTDAATQFIFLRLSLPASVATDIDIREPMSLKASAAPEFVPAVDGLGVLLVGDNWDGSANASSSTRTAGSLSASLASFGSLYLRYSTDGVTVVNTVLTGPGSVGGVGTVAYSGGVLTITSSGPLWIGAAIAYPTLSPSQKTYLDGVATSALTWTM